MSLFMVLCLTHESVYFVKTLQAFNSDALEINVWWGQAEDGVLQLLAFIFHFLITVYQQYISWVVPKCDSVVIEFVCQHSSGPQSSLENTVII